jgi:selenocysteine lyase/cysteine desulfurase
MLSADRPRRAFLGALAAGPLAAMGSPFGADGGPRPATPQTSDFLFAPGLVYLQTASLGPTPKPVIDRTLAAWRELELNPTLYGYGALEQAMEDVRAGAAAFVGAAKEEIVLTGSTTEGMNWVAQGLGLRAGDHVLTTDQEHPGGRACWDYVARKDGVVIDIVAIPPGENDAAAIVDRFEKAITPRTRVLSFSHVLSSTGLRMPVRELCALARRRGCLSVVDGAQAVGAIDVDVKGLGCSVYATSGHKWLLGPKGTGLLYLSEEIGTAVDPIALQGGRAAYCDSSGFRNVPGILGLAEAVRYVSALGKPAVEAHNVTLRDRAHETLKALPKLRVVSPPPGPLSSPLLSFMLPDGLDSRDLQLRLLERHNVMVKVVPRNWFNGNRVAFHLFNTDDDVERLRAALATELSS